MIILTEFLFNFFYKKYVLTISTLQITFYGFLNLNVLISKFCAYEFFSTFSIDDWNTIFLLTFNTNYLQNINNSQIQKRLFLTAKQKNRWKMCLTLSQAINSIGFLNLAWAKKQKKYKIWKNGKTDKLEVLPLKNVDQLESRRGNARGEKNFRARKNFLASTVAKNKPI